MNLLKIPAMSVQPFRRLSFAWLFGNFGDSLLFLTLPIWVKALTGSDSAAGLVFLALGLPVFLAPLAGYVADRMRRKHLLIAANLFCAVVALSLLLVRDASHVWLIYLVTFVYGMLMYVNSGAQSGLLRDMLADDQLASANGLLTTIDQGLRVLSPVIGAALFAVFGGHAVALATAGSLLITAALLTRVHVDETGPTPREERESFRRELTAGFRHIRGVPLLARLTALMAVVFMITGLMNTTVFAAIDQGFNLPVEAFGVAAGIQGAGSILGGLTAAIVIARLDERRAIGIAFLGLAAGVATALTGLLPVGIVGAFVVGLVIPWMVVAFVTFRQRVTPAHLQGRVSAATNMALNGPQTLGTAAGAAALLFLDWRLVIAAEAVLIAACALPLLIGRRYAEAGEPDDAPVAPGSDMVAEPLADAAQA